MSGGCCGISGLIRIRVDDGRRSPRPGSDDDSRPSELISRLAAEGVFRGCLGVTVSLTPVDDKG
jgi:hypothetical protein